jgi:hypothetical protein
MQINISGSETEIIVPPNRDWKYVFVFVAGSLVLLPLFVLSVMSLAIQMIRQELHFSIELLSPLLLFPIFISYALWLTIGKEKLLFKGQFAEYVITNGIFRFRRKWEVKNISNLNMTAKVYNTDSPFFRDASRIKFQYNGKYVGIFAGLKDVEIEKAGEILRNKIRVEDSEPYQIRS